CFRAEFRFDCRNLSWQYVSRRSINCNDLVLLDCKFASGERLSVEVDFDLFATDYGWFAHPAGYDCSVRCHTSPTREDTFSGDHAMNVFGSCFFSYQDDAFATLTQLVSLIGI